MNFKPIIIICGEPNSIFSEILVKSFKKYKFKKPIVLIGSYKLISLQLKKLKLRYKINKINNDYSLKNLKKNTVSIIDIDYNFKKPFEKISTKSNYYISQCFKKFFKIVNSNDISGIINGPISKSNFLKKNYKGITEYFSEKYKLKENYAMLIFNKSLSVAPITTHLPINKVSKNLTKKSIILKIQLISKFYRKIFLKKPRIAVCGLNPHCENFFGISEEKKIIEPAKKNLIKKKINLKGPMPADTVFLKENLKKFDVVVGMYHDQVLAPIKSIHGFSAINITLGLPFLRISPDHGPNTSMLGKNRSNTESLIEAIKFLDKLK